MKTNNYMSLCREQAALSPLHYRHGCVIVRGGKVIGQGFNDLRAGFDGGALKHGRIASGALDGPAIMDLKRKRKFKPQPESKSSENTNTKSFTPYEAMGGGHRANVPLSMHSEMMAIHSAIARSSTLTATAVSSVKPSFKLPGSSKRKAKLRQEALNASLARTSPVQSVARASTLFKSGVLKPLHLDRSKVYNNKSNDKEDVNEEKKVEKLNRMKNEKKNHQMKKKKGYQYQYDPSGQQKVHAPQSASKESTTATKSLRNDGSISSGYSVINPPTNDDRADLYVARFGSQNTKTSGKTKSRTACCNSANPPDPCIGESSSLSLSLSRTSTSTASTTGSLHDELLNPHPRNSIQTSPPPPDPFDWSTVHASRPCYRCVSYMHSVGVKRVFWSNDEGKWEGAKVRDLVDALDMSTSSIEGGEDGESAGKRLLESGVFITKHEVLMMRRVMGAE
ncbi:hypothetical protein Vi05172_g1486 [Venturia inaequalis]|nr:hypothetical protein Vi05172_g1486 [Venturia inaequalis]